MKLAEALAALVSTAHLVESTAAEAYPLGREFEPN